MDLEQKAIERIRLASEMSLKYYEKPIIDTYSGGKDSDVMLHLFEISGVPFEVSNSHTTVDAPQTIYHIRNTFKRLDEKGIKTNIDYHTLPNGKRQTMWKLIVDRQIPPTRLARYCCKELKEGNGDGRMISIGVRWDESTQRKSREEFEAIGSKRSNGIFVSKEKLLLADQDKDARRLFERCELRAKTVVNPIIDWTEQDVWEYIQSEKIETNDLYKCGYKRVGCIGCPMARYKEREREFMDFPKYKQAYINAFSRMLDRRKALGKDDSKGNWTSGEAVFHWWIEDPNVYGQLSFEDVWKKDLLV